jgi:hypothetical protein
MSEDTLGISKRKIDFRIILIADAMNIQRSNLSFN